MIISISGPAGSGTTTISKIIARKLGLEHVYAGQMIRDMAEAKGMTIYEFNEFVEHHPEIDREVDDTVVRKAHEGKKLLEGRLSGWMMKHHDIAALKIYFSIDSDIAAGRVSERDRISLEEALARNEERERRHWERFEKLYDVSKDDLSVYDIIVDTSGKTIDEVVAEVESAVKAYSAG